MTKCAIRCLSFNRTYNAYMADENVVTSIIMLFDIWQRTKQNKKKNGQVMVDWLLILYWVIQAQQKRQNAFKWTLARYNQRSTCTNITCIWIYVVAQPREHNQNMQTDDIKMQRKINTSRTCNSNNANENHIMLFNIAIVVVVVISSFFLLRWYLQMNNVRELVFGGVLNERVQN